MTAEIESRAPTTTTQPYPVWSVAIDEQRYVLWRPNTVTVWDVLRWLATA